MANTMRSLAVRKYCKPADYEVMQLPLPVITKPGQVLIRVHAAGIMTGDTQFAAGMAKLFMTLEFPLKLGITGAGIVADVARDVTSLKIGDPVYGLIFRHGQPDLERPGFASDYALAPADLLLIKPDNVTFEEVTALCGPAITSYQCIKRYLELTNQPPDSTLEGKTVFMPGALSASGSVGAQVIKNVFRATTLISTVSTVKIPLVDEYLPGVVDKLIDYTTEDIVDSVGRGTVDYVFNTQWDLVGTFPLAKRDTGAVVSIASVPSAATIRNMFGPSGLGWLTPVVALFSHLVYLWYGWNLRGTNVLQDFVSGNPGKREDAERTREWIAEGKLKPVMTVVDIDHVEAVRSACEKVATGKGGLGLLVLKFV
ncbi:GroES (chaperonin 10)-like protein [Naviculisporaceae sp. PSN 640]